MTRPHTFKVVTSLADKMRRPGGRSVRSALAAADTAVESHRAEAMKSAVNTLAQLQAITAARDDGQAKRVYERAAALVDLIGFFETGPLYDAAYSLCDVSDRMQAAGVWHWPSVEVHLDALALILSGDCGRTAATDNLLSGLRAIRDRIPRLPDAAG